MIGNFLNFLTVDIPLLTFAYNSKQQCFSINENHSS